MTLRHCGTFFHLLITVYIFSKSAARLPAYHLWWPRRRSLKSSESQDGEKKKSKGGFLNLIKRSSKSDKAEKSEKSQAQAAAAPNSSASSAAQNASISEEPSSPKVAVKSPAPEPKSR